MLDRSLLPAFIRDRLSEHWLVLFDRYVSFFITGATGVALNLFITWSLTTLLFGRDQYFYAYLIGLAVNLVYNFVRHALFTFQTKSSPVLRFVVFIVYSLAMAGLQAVTVRELVAVTGETYYLVVIAAVIFVFSTVTFVVCNYWLFNDDYF